MDLMHTIEVLAPFIVILILDFKGDFVDTPARLGRDLWDHYSTAEGFRWGLAPPVNCTDYLGWINQVTKIIAVHWDLKFSEGTLAAALRIALGLLNQPLTVPPGFASLLLLEQLLQVLPAKMIAKKEEWLRSAQQRIEQIRRISGTLFEAEHGFDVVKHLVIPQRCAVIDCTRLSPVLAQMFVNLLALQIIFPRIAQRQVSRHTNLVLIIDEADQFCSQEACSAYPEGYSQLGGLIKQGRAFGCLPILSTSVCGSISRTIRANIRNHFMFNQTDPDSVVAAAHTLLAPESTQLLSSQQVGECVFKESMGPVPHAMLVKVDHVPASDMPRPTEFSQHSYTPARGMEEIPGLPERIQDLCKEFQKTVLRQQQTSHAGCFLSRLERELLDQMMLYEVKCEPLYRLFARMGNPSPATQKSLINKLVKKGLLEATQIRTSKSAVRIGYPTELAWHLVNKQPQLKPLRGGLTHKTVTRWASLYDLRNGATESACEFPLPGSRGFCDVGSTFNGVLHCWETVIDCFSNVCQHARACFLESQAVKTVTFVTLLKSDSDKVRTALMADADLAPFLGRIRFLQVDEILKSLFAQE